MLCHRLPGFVGSEYFNPWFSSPVEHGDVLACAKAAAAALAEDPARITRLGMESSAYVLAGTALARSARSCLSSSSHFYTLTVDSS